MQNLLWDLGFALGCADALRCVCLLGCTGVRWIVAVPPANVLAAVPPADGLAGVPPADGLAGVPPADGLAAVPLST